MTDSPAVQIPLDPKEQPILDHIFNIRNKLSLLKRDKSTYIKSHDVLALYEQIIEQVHLLNVIRKEHSKPREQNRGWWSCVVVQMDPLHFQSIHSSNPSLPQLTVSWRTVFSSFRFFFWLSGATMRPLQCKHFGFQSTTQSTDNTSHLAQLFDDFDNQSMFLHIRNESRFDLTMSSVSSIIWKKLPSTLQRISTPSVIL